ncbi:hypothetical protein [Corallococcus sp. 4LFB]|uniref:hypothetical protein n=1 Tax=Corallococcus sp. 4LFB TaxID=3383249 RepID=UPI0039753498
MTTSPTSPPAQSPSLEGWLNHGKLVAGIVVFTCTVCGSALAAYYGATARTDLVEAKVDRVATRVEQVATSVEEQRTDAERKRQQDQEALNARLGEQERARAADHEALVRLQEQLRAVGDQTRAIATDVRVVLERVNAPRPRVVREYP